MWTYDLAQKSLPIRRPSKSAQAQKGTLLMNEQEYYRRVDQLVTRMNRMEAMVQALLNHLGINPGELTPHEPPEIRAIREALLAGNKMKAIQLYRGLYGVGLKEAQDALDAM
jgi:ribosomal protein L7/L12